MPATCKLVYALVGLVTDTSVRFCLTTAPIQYETGVLQQYMCNNLPCTAFFWALLRANLKGGFKVEIYREREQVNS